MNEWIFDPVLLHLGPLQIRWYGLMYVISFIFGTYLAKRLVRSGFFQIPIKKIDLLVTYLILGMFLGARIFYVFIYNWESYSQNLLKIFAIWEGGLSFHGALTGMLVAGYLFGKKHGVSWGQVMDVVALSGSPGLFLGRMGNFINGELYGRVVSTPNHPFGMVFPGGGPYPRHPSQLYEGVAEGILLSLLLWAIYKRSRYYGITASIFLLGYSLFRFLVEFFREPDPQLGFYFGGGLTMGQILCVIMFGVGAVALLAAQKRAEWLPQRFTGRPPRR